MSMDDLSYDDNMMSASTSVPATRSDKFTVIVGTKQPNTSMTSNMSQSYKPGGRGRLRASQRLQLMKMQSESEAKPRGSSSQNNIPSMQQESLSHSASSGFFGSFPQSSSSHPSLAGSSNSLLPSLHDYVVSPPNWNDEDVLLSDLSSILDESASSYASDLNVPSMANSCLVGFQNEVQIEEEKTSSSCPLIPLRPAEMIQPYRGGRKKEPAPPFFPTEESRMLWQKEREKKDQHNNIEKKRRSKINDFIQELATLLPDNYDIDLQNKKGNILEASVDYIRKLKKEEELLGEMKRHQSELELKNRKLQMQIRVLQMTTQQGQAPAAQVQPAALVQPASSLLLTPPPHAVSAVEDHAWITSDLVMFNTEDLGGFINVPTLFDSMLVAEGNGGVGEPQIPVTVEELMDFSLN